MLCLWIGACGEYRAVWPASAYTPDSEKVTLPSAEIYIGIAWAIWMPIYSSGLFRYNGHSSTLYTEQDELPSLQPDAKMLGKKKTEIIS